MRQLISSRTAFEQAAAYSRAVVIDGWVFVSGTMGSDPETGALPPDFAAQCRNAFAIIEKALAEAGATLADTVQVRVFLADRADIGALVPILKEKFTDIMPANTTLIAAMPAEAARIEIELIARKGA